MDAIQQIINQMINAAKAAAGTQWGSIKTPVVHELEILGQRVRQIAEGLHDHEITPEDAKDFFAVVRNHAVGNIALATTLVLSSAQKVVDAALQAAKTGINGVIGIAIV
jgi:hypothetical protein